MFQEECLLLEARLEGKCSASDRSWLPQAALVAAVVIGAHSLQLIARLLRRLGLVRCLQGVQAEGPSVDFVG